MTSFTKEYDEIGLVLFERSRRARNMNISVRPFKGVRVAVPDGVPFRLAEKMVLAKKLWIIRKINQLKEKERRIRDLQPQISLRDATAILARRVAELAAEHGFTYGKVTARQMTSRWGSCSPEKNISLNIMLLKLPSVLRDYVILHELVHTVHKNHGVRFWTTLSDICGVANARHLQRQLNQFGNGEL
ncbi:MAG: M48 family metallopeptidase [Fidelibacterota bacterium]